MDWKLHFIGSTANGVLKAGVVIPLIFPNVPYKVPQSSLLDHYLDVPGS